MSHEAAEPMHQIVRPVQVERPPLAPDAQPAEAAAAVPNEQERLALDAVFAARPAEPSPVPALLGLWSGGLLLHDLMEDHLTRPDEEDEPDPESPERPPG